MDKPKNFAEGKKEKKIGKLNFNESKLTSYKLVLLEIIIFSKVPIFQEWTDIWVCVIIREKLIRITDRGSQVFQFCNVDFQHWFTRGKYLAISQSLYVKHHSHFAQENVGNCTFPNHKSESAQSIYCWKTSCKVFYDHWMI